MATGPLEGLRVVEWALDLPGSYCGKLLADLGAEVIKIEEPEGDPVRRLGPFPNDVPGQEQSALFLYLNNNKLGITLDLRSAGGKRILKGLLSDTDIFVVDCPVATLRDCGLEYTQFSDSNSQLICTAITPFGLTGPYKDYKTTDLVSFHMSGFGHATPGNVEDPEKERPLRAGGRQADFAAGVTAAVASMHAVFARWKTGRGQLVDVSRLEAISAFNLGNVSTYSFSGQVPVRHKGGRRPGSVVALIPCADGWVCLVAMMEYQWQAFLETLGSPEWGSWEVFQDRYLRAEHWDVLEPLLHEVTRRFTKDALAAACQAKRVPCLPVNSIAEMVGSPQFASRTFFVHVRHPVLGDVRVPRSPYVFSATPLSIRRPAPLLGEHTAQVLRERLGLGEQEIAKLQEAREI